MADPQYDYIVVGAGSAGCVLAARLSEDPATRVLLLEAGPPDRSIWIHLPIGYGKTMWDSRYNWCFHTDPEPTMNGRRIYWPRGKTLGGSSAINGLIYIRGQREDYDHWRALGNIGWGYDDVLPYFIRSECNERGASPFHGGNGPQRVSNIAHRHALIDAFIDGAASLGVPRNDDFNGATQEGAGYFQLTTRKGWRSSAATAYLKPARRRPNLRIETGAYATKLLLEGRRATGVSYRQNGRDLEAHCTREVLLAAGAIQSPQLLQLSGIGPPALLAQHGIAVVHELPGVGENLQDHLQIRLIYECTQPITTNDELRSLVGRIKIGLQWLFARRGPLGGRHQSGRLLHARSAVRGSNAGHPVSCRHVVGRYGGRCRASVLRIHAIDLPAAAGVTRTRRDPIARPNATAVNAAPLSNRRTRSPDNGGWYARGARHRAIRTDAGIRATRSQTRSRSHQRRRTVGVCAQQWRDDLSPIGHMQDGQRPAGGRRRAAASARDQWSASG